MLNNVLEQQSQSYLSTYFEKQFCSFQKNYLSRVMVHSLINQHFPFLVQYTVEFAEITSRLCVMSHSKYTVQCQLFLLLYVNSCASEEKQRFLVISVYTLHEADITKQIARRHVDMLVRPVKKHYYYLFHLLQSFLCLPPTLISIDIQS